MDLQYIETAAETIFRMCRAHPEICPHDFRWVRTKTLGNGKEEVHFVCQLCGKENIEIQEEKN